MTRPIAMFFALLALVGCQTLDAENAAAQTITRIVIAGDSTAADYPPERINQIGWGQALPYFLPNDVPVMNLAVNGRSTKSFIDEGKWVALVEQVGTGDLVLISFGHNDSRDDAPERHAPAMGAYKNNLERFVADVRSAGAQAVVHSPAARRLWEGPAMVETHGLYRLAAEQAAGESGAAFIDLSNLSLAYFEGIGREETKRDFVWLTRPHWKTGEMETLEDNTHFTFLGACGVARLITIELDGAGLVDANPGLTMAAAEMAGRPKPVIDCADALQRR
ncbi:MAG: rhamnogalacturonan acetylesterase [Pseudomonadota bacterium]